MSKLHTIENIVLQILEENPQARQDDYILMVKVCEKTNPEILNRPFELVMKTHFFNLPNWESVTRCRRKIQANRPDLDTDITSRKRRRKREQEYKEYARS